MKPPRIIELVGVAGAGKTTIARALSQRSNRILLCEQPYFRRIDQFPFFAWNTLLMVPTFTRFYSRKNGRWFTPREMAWMVILNGWHQVLQRQASDKCSIIVLDQGPISLLAELNIFGPECIKNHRGKEWLDKIYSDWANTLDMLVWLDTSDSALMKRVRTRRKWHLIKEQSDQEAIDFNASFRETYQRLISMLSVSANSPTVIGFNTGQESLDAIVDKLLLALDINNHTVSIPR